MAPAPSAEGPTPVPSRRARHAMTVLWPSFLAAGVLEMLVFAVVDPHGLHGFGGAPIEWPALAVYTVAFFVFWGVVAVAGYVSLTLGTAADGLDDAPTSARPS